MIEAGDQVPADGRIVNSATLEIEESALTGESVATPKEVATVAQADAPLGDRVDMAYMNTLVTRGTGTVVVTSTGMTTEIGRIARMLDSVSSEKVAAPAAHGPVQQATRRAGVHRARHRHRRRAVARARLDEVLLLGVAMAVAAIPTGLPTVVTTLLSKMDATAAAAAAAAALRRPARASGGT